MHFPPFVGGLVLINILKYEWQEVHGSMFFQDSIFGFWILVLLWHISGFQISACITVNNTRLQHAPYCIVLLHHKKRPFHV
jgi:hypothetical protein